MTEVTIVGADIAKNVFHLHGAASDGSVVFCKKLIRTQFQRFMASHPTCVVVMEACGGAHHWAREMKLQGHEPRLIAPGDVRPFVKRQKNDMADAEAIVEAALRPTMRFVEGKDEAAQARCMLFRIRDQIVRQLSQTVNALRAFLAEFGQVAPVGMQNVNRLAAIVADTATSLPALARELCEEMLERIAECHQLGVVHPVGVFSCGHGVPPFWVRVVSLCACGALGRGKSRARVWTH